MKGRLLQAIFVLAAILTALNLVAIAVSYARPTSIGVEAVEWDLRENVRQFSSYVGLERGRVAWFGDHRPAREPLKQHDWAFARLDTGPSGIRHAVRLPPRADGTVAFMTSVGSPSMRSVPLVWPLIAFAAIALLTLVAKRRWPAPIVRPRRSRGAILCRTLAVVAATLLLAAVVFCVRGYPYFERFDVDVPFIAGPQGVQVNSSRGSLMVAWTEAGPARTLSGGRFLYVRSTIPESRGPLWKAAELKGDRYEQFLGFTLGWDGGSGLWRNVLIVPYWSVFVALALVTFAFARLARRFARRHAIDEAKRCPACGYDLRASPDRCPECGVAAAD